MYKFILKKENYYLIIDKISLMQKHDFKAPSILAAFRYGAPLKYTRYTDETFSVEYNTRADLFKEGKQ